VEKQICLITGATEDVCKATEIEFARKEFTVVLAARYAAKAQQVMKERSRSSGNADADYIIGDLRSLQQVRQLAETFNLQYPMVCGTLRGRTS
jgi:short-subunit dehydrogenase